MKRYRYRSDPPIKLFQGETMTCIRCGRVEKSDPHIESNWTAIQLESKIFYVCPVCFGNFKTTSQIFPMPKK